MYYHSITMIITIDVHNRVKESNTIKIKSINTDTLLKKERITVIVTMAINMMSITNEESMINNGESIRVKGENTILIPRTEESETTRIATKTT